VVFPDIGKNGESASRKIDCRRSFASQDDRVIRTTRQKDRSIQD
jgi:hypothetical protein